MSHGPCLPWLLYVLKKPYLALWFFIWHVPILLCRGLSLRPVSSSEATQNSSVGNYLFCKVWEPHWSLPFGNSHTCPCALAVTVNSSFIHECWGSDEATQIQNPAIIFVEVYWNITVYTLNTHTCVSVKSGEGKTTMELFPTDWQERLRLFVFLKLWVILRLKYNDFFFFLLNSVQATETI